MSTLPPKSTLVGSPFQIKTKECNEEDLPQVETPSLSKRSLMSLTYKNLLSMRINVTHPFSRSGKTRGMVKLYVGTEEESKGRLLQTWIVNLNSSQCTDSAHTLPREEPFLKYTFQIIRCHKQIGQETPLNKQSFNSSHLLDSNQGLQLNITEGKSNKMDLSLFATSALCVAPIWQESRALWLRQNLVDKFEQSP
ncbi:MAG: hypothetical protein S4CHLAM7_10640 [Chlamydiae bacterium]|nr:hypothetical protein [Chlamydiota bacterium]